MSEPFSDGVLIEESRRGSPVAFDALMRRYERLVFAVAWTYTRERESALDVTQQVFLKVYQKLGTVRTAGAFKAWLVRIACRESLNWQRRHRHLQEVEAITADWPGSDAAAPEKDLLYEEDLRRLRDSMAQLPLRQRLAVTLRYFEGLPVREVAAALRCSEGTGKNLLFRGLRRLRDKLAGCAMEKKP